MAKVRRRASVICLAEGHRLAVRLRDPSTGVIAPYPPGGGIEPGELPVETARREALEETGLVVRVRPDIEVVDTYPFRWDAIDYEVTTHYFGATLEGPFVREIPPVIDASYNLGASWVPTAEALAAMRVHPAIAASVAKVLALW